MKLRWCVLHRIGFVSHALLHHVMLLQRQLEEEARAKQFRARQFNPAMFSGVQPRARRSEPARNARSSLPRPLTAPKTTGSRPDQRHSYRQEILEGEFSNDSTMARRAMVLAREVCFHPSSHCTCNGAARVS